MTINLPTRKYLTFSELIARWKCDANDVRSAIVSGALVPSIFVQEALKGFWIEYEPDLRPGAFDLDTTLAQDRPSWLNRFLYLRCALETGVHSCQFGVLCDSATAQPGDNRGADWFDLPPGTVTLADVEARGVFMLTEVARFESGGTANELDNRPLSTKERDSMLRIIYGMAVAAPYRYDPAAARNEATATIASATAAAGCPTDADTVRKYLQEAARKFGKAGSKAD